MINAMANDVTHVAGVDNKIADALSRLSEGADFPMSVAPDVEQSRAVTGDCYVWPSTRLTSLFKLNSSIIFIL